MEAEGKESNFSPKDFAWKSSSFLVLPVFFLIIFLK